MPDGDGATTPAALPVTVKALTRNSGCAQVITMLRALGGVQHHADQPLRRHDRVERRDAVAGARAEQQGAAVGGLGLMQHLGGDVGAGQAAAQREELAQALVLGEQRRQALGEVGGGIALGGDGAEAGPAGLALLGP